MKLIITFLFLSVIGIALGSTVSLWNPTLSRNALFKKLTELETEAVNGTIVKTYYLSKIFKATWYGSFSLCRHYEMDFLSIESKEEEALLLSIMNEQSAAYQTVNIGMINGGSTDAWISTKTGKLVSYPINWYTGQPNDKGVTEHRCGCIHVEGAVKKITQNWCHTHEYHFICEHVQFKD